MIKRILITGGAGFIGSQLCKFLKDDNHEYHITILDNMLYGYIDNIIEQGKFIGDCLIIKDIRDTNLDEYIKDIDIVIHLAGISCLPACQEKPLLAYDINVNGTINILEYARRHNIKRVVFSSTSAVYENNTEKYLHEDLHVDPDLIYSMSKKAAEDICKSYAKNYEMDIVIMRFFNVFGSHQDIHRKNPPFTSYISKELANDHAPILFNNDESVRRDYIYIDDLLNLLKCIIDSDKKFQGDIFNCASGNSYSVPEMYNMMKVISDKNLDAKYVDPTTYWNNYTHLFNCEKSLSKNRIVKEVYKSSYACIDKVKTSFHWIPTTNMMEGLKKVYTYAKNILNNKH